MRVIIAGGRKFNDYPLLKNKMDELLINETDIEIVSGKAMGADTLGELYANANGYNIKEFPALWEQYGKSAGYKRNEQMAEYADMLVAFWDGESKGTKHMIDIAKNKGLRVEVVKYEIPKDPKAERLKELYRNKKGQDKP